MTKIEQKRRARRLYMREWRRKNYVAAKPMSKTTESRVYADIRAMIDIFFTVAQEAFGEDWLRMLARKSGLSESTLTAWQSGRIIAPRGISLMRVARCLNMSVSMGADGQTPRLKFVA